MRSILLLVLAWEESGKDFFSNDQIIPIRITILDRDVRTLERAPRQGVPVEVKWAEQPLARGTVHLKGHGSFRPISKKPSFTIHFE